MRSNPKTISRKIDPTHLKRAGMVQSDQIGPYMEAILQEMYKALDSWRYGKKSSDDFKLALDACIALFTEAELRGLA